MLISAIDKFVSTASIHFSCVRVLVFDTATGGYVILLVFDVARSIHIFRSALNRKIQYMHDINIYVGTCDFKTPADTFPPATGRVRWFTPDNKTTINICKKYCALKY